jgi:autotransporter-associated beta strand protein
LVLAYAAGGSASVGSLAGGGTVTSATSNTLIITTGATFSGAVTGSIGITKAGTGGTQTLSSVNTYTGATTVTGGALAVSGTISAASPVTVAVAPAAPSGANSGTIFYGAAPTIGAFNITCLPTALFTAYTVAAWSGTATGPTALTCNGVAVVSGTPFTVNGHTAVVTQGATAITIAVTA